MTTLARRQRQDFEARLADEQRQQEEARRQALRQELRASQARLADLGRELADEDAYAQLLMAQLLGGGALANLAGLPRELVEKIGRALPALNRLALSLCSRALHQTLAESVRRALLRHYSQPRGRVEARELLQPAVFVSLVVRAHPDTRGTTVVRQTGLVVPPGGRYNDCHRCRRTGHDVAQCPVPCRHCGQCGHGERRCPLLRRDPSRK